MRRAARLLHSARRALGILAVTVALAPAALAGPEAAPASVQWNDDDGSVVARVLVNAPVDDVRRAIAEVQHTPSGNVLELRFRPDGDCQSVFRKTRGVWDPLIMQTRLCPTQQGWREQLVSSDDYSVYDAEWVVRSLGDTQTDVQVRVRTSVNLSVPSFLLKRGMVDGMQHTLSNVLKRLVAPRAAASE